MSKKTGREYRELITLHAKHSVDFTQYHVRKRLRERPVTEEEIVNKIFDLDKIVYVDEQEALSKGERKFRVRHYKSNRYDLTVILVFSKDRIYVVSAWYDDKKFINMLKSIR